MNFDGAAAAWPLIGRGEELERALTATAPGAGGLVLAGAAGVGKTRLAAEVFDHWNGSGRRCARFVATRSASTVPLGVFADVAGTGGDTVRRIRDVIAALADRGTGVVPVLLVIDDAHLLDEQSALVLHQIVRHHRADVVLTVRRGQPVPDAVVGLWKDELLACLDLQPLSREETTDLLTRVLRGQIESSTAAALWRFTRGNVLHLRYLAEGERVAGRLRCRDGVWVWDGRMEVPTPLRELIDTAIGRRPGPVLAVLDVLAVADPIEIEVLVALIGGSAVEEAVAAELVTLDAEATVARLTHPLIGEVRRARLLPARAKKLCGELARELAGRSDAGGPIALVRRAVLVCDSDLSPDPVLLTEAARAAMRLSDPITAERLASHAVAAGGGTAARTMHVYGLVETQQFQKALAAATRAAALAATPRSRFLSAATAALIEETMGGHPENKPLAALETKTVALGLRAPYDALVAYSAAFRTEPRLAVHAARAALDSGDRLHGAVETAALIALAAGNAMLGRYSEVTAPADRGARLARDADWTSTNHLLLGIHRLLGLHTAGYLSRADELVDQLISERLDFPIAHSYWSFVKAFGAYIHGDLTTTFARGREARAITLPAESTWTSDTALLYQILAAAMSGDAPTATSLLDEYRPPGPSMEAVRPRNIHLLARAWTAAATGLPSRAAALAGEAAGLAQHQEFFAFEVLARQTAAQFGDRCQADRLDELATLVEGPRVMAAARHARALRIGDPDALLDAARCYTELGDRIAAADVYSQAAEAYRTRGRRGTALTTAATAREFAAATGADTPALRALRYENPLTPRQREVIALVAAGLTNREIAEKLVMSIRTVEGHLFRASQRTGINNRDQLTTLLEPDSTSRPNTRQLPI
ncbi:LuxR C-terminal-related transcriptional regulator [Nocardia sp. NPDC003482]